MDTYRAFHYTTFLVLAGAVLSYCLPLGNVQDSMAKQTFPTGPGDYVAKRGGWNSWGWGPAGKRSSWAPSSDRKLDSPAYQMSDYTFDYNDLCALWRASVMQGIVKSSVGPSVSQPISTQNFIIVQCASQL